ncbi:MAG: Ig-like domain-containing protein [Oscillospiraceae bacterium]|nr:Ig-like domain-containing protein [Oscillospiraceae bacterium]
MKKRILGIVLALAMLMSAFPAYAENNINIEDMQPAEPEPAAEETLEQPEEVSEAPESGKDEEPPVIIDDAEISGEQDADTDEKAPEEPLEDAADTAEEAEQPENSEEEESVLSEEDELLAEDYRAWSQYDSRWADLPLGSSSSQVKKGGCLVTSVTKIVIQAGLKSAASFNVADMVKLLNSNGGFTSSGDLYWGAPANVISGLKYAGNLWGDSYNNYSTTPDKLQDKLIGWINSGYHMILGVNGCGHWVVVDEAKTLQTGKIYIMDSGSSSASWNVDVLLSSRYTNINCVAAYTGGKAGGVAAEPEETALQEKVLVFSNGGIAVNWGWGLFEQAPAYNDTLNLASLYLSEGAEAGESAVKTRITGLGFEKLSSNGKFASVTAAQPAVELGCKTYTGPEGKRTVICAVVRGAAAQPESAGISGTAAANIYSAVSNYINKNKTENTVLWLSGFGNGGAAAARLAELLAEKKILAANRIMTYTFGSPNCAEPYQNAATAVFNTVSRLDTAAYLPLGAKRLGTARILSPGLATGSPHSVAEYYSLISSGSQVPQVEAEGEQQIDRVVIQGPASLQLLDEAGSLLATGAEGNRFYPGFQLEVSGQTATILRSSDQPVILKLTGIGTGSLNLSAQTINIATGEAVYRHNFTGVSCENGKHFSLQLQSQLNELNLYAEDQNGEVIAQVLPDGTERDWPDSAQLSLTQEKILLKQGESFQLTASCEPQRYLQRITWSAEDADGTGTQVVQVAADGTVTALAEGNAWVTAAVEVAGVSYTAACRVEVLAAEEESVAPAVLRAALESSSAAVKLYSTNYTRVAILLETAQSKGLLMVLRPEDELPQKEDTGAAITAARFEDEKAAELFSLRVADDHILEIVPNYTALELAQQNSKAIAGSYSSAIIVTVDGAEIETKTEKGTEQRLTFSVSKSMPSIHASSLKMNSYLSGQSKALVFTGGKVLSVQPDLAAAAKNGKLDASSWLEIGPDELSLRLKAGTAGKQSGKMYLLCAVEGWAVLCPVAVSVTAAETAPKLSLSASSVKLLSGTSDTAAVSWKATPAEFSDAELRVLSITEGSGSSMKTYANGTVLNCEIRQGVIRMTAPKAAADGKDHSYRVNLVLSAGGREKQFSLSASVLRAAASHSVSVTQSGSIDLSVPNSPIRLKVSISNYHLGSGEKLWVEMLKYTNGVYQPADDLFSVSQKGNLVEITEKTTGSLAASAAWYAKVNADLDLDGNADSSKLVQLKVICSAPDKVQPSASIRVSGSLDMIRPDSRVTVTPSFKNLYGYVLAPSDLQFYRLENKLYVPISEDENPFAVEMDGAKYVIRIAELSKIVLGTKYQVRLEADLGRNGTILKSGKQPMSFTVKMGSVKVTADRTSLVFFRSDRYGYADITLTPQTGAAAVDHAALDAKAAQYYELVELGSGRYRIMFRDNCVAVGAKSLTAKVSVWLKGNPTEKANTTVNVKITLKTIK